MAFFRSTRVAATDAKSNIRSWHSLVDQVNAKTVWLDGEICVLDEQGRARFEMIQPRIIPLTSTPSRNLRKRRPTTLFLFDVLYVDGYDLRAVPLEDRKRLLQTLVVPSRAH